MSNDVFGILLLVCFVKQSNIKLNYIALETFLILKIKKGANLKCI